MAHLVENMVFVGQLPWHGLGTEINPDLSVAEVLEVAGLNWQVEKVPLYHQTSSGLSIVPDKYGLKRSSDETILDLVGKTYQPTQNIDAFEFFNEFVKAGDMYLETAGSLDKGRATWALAKLKEEFKVKNDLLQSYLLLSNPHRFGKSIQVAQTDVRVVCNNTITRALCEIDSQGTGFRMSHASKFDYKIREKAKQILGIAKQNMEELKKQVEFLSSKLADKEKATYYITQLFPKGNDKEEMSKNGQKVLSYYLDNMTPGAELETAKGTFWGLSNATTYFLTHEYGRSQEKRLLNDFYGGIGVLKRKSFDLAMEMAKVA